MKKIEERPLIILHGEIKTPPLNAAARVEAGVLIRRLQRGETIGMPLSRPMPSIGARCAELRITDEDVIWRVVYRVDEDAIVVAEVFPKKTQATPKTIIGICKKRFKEYDRVTKGA